MRDELTLKPQAFVDWIDVEFKTYKTTNLKHMRELVKTLLKKSVYILGLSEYPMCSCSHFILRINDPKSYKDVELFFKKLDRKIPLIEQCTHLVGIEFGIDFWNSSPSFCTYLAKNVVNKIDISQRFYRRKSEQRKIPIQEKTMTKFFEADWQLAYGHKRTMSSQYKKYHGDQLSQHCYFKKTDNKQVLPRDQHRARYEVTLHLNSIYDFGFSLADIKFEKMHRRWFTWEGDQSSALLNEQVRSCLRALSKKWNNDESVKHLPSAPIFK